MPAVLHCAECGKQTVSEEDLVDHLTTYHLRWQPLSCYFCTKAHFSSETMIRLHFEQHHKGRPPKAKHSLNLDKQNELLKLVTDSYTVSGVIRVRRHPMECRWFACGLCFDSPLQLREHRMRHNGDRPIACPICRACFSTTMMLLTHVKLKHNGGGVAKPSPAYLDSDYDEETSAASFAAKCDDCNQECATYIAIHRHVGRHLSANGLVASDQVLSPRSAFGSHNKRTRTPRYECGWEKCAKRFCSLNETRRHEAIHTSAMPFPCEHCDQRYKRPCHLQKHVRKWHNAVDGKIKFEKKQAVISTDNEFCEGTSDLDCVTSRSQPRSFKCSYCDTRFTSEAALNLHISAKHNQQHVASASFNEVGSATPSERNNSKTKDCESKHMLPFYHQHEKQRQRYLCSECGKRFDDERKLTAHIELHHHHWASRLQHERNDVKSRCKRFRCQWADCDTLFLTLSALHQHERLHFEPENNHETNRPSADNTLPKLSPCWQTWSEQSFDRGPPNNSFQLTWAEFSSSIGVNPAGTRSANNIGNNNRCDRF